MVYTNSNKARIGVCAYLILYSLISILAFRYTSIVSYSGMLYLVLSLHVFPILLVNLYNTSIYLHLLVLVSAPLLLVLIVIDPQEVGLYGYDPYMYTLPSAAQFLNAPTLSDFVNSTNSLPAFYSLYHVFQNILGIGSIPAAKYLPLSVVLIPTLFYITCRRIVDTKQAFTIAMVAASIRQLYLFESKFVDESLAVVMFFVMAFVLLGLGPMKNKRSIILILPVCITLFLTHAVVPLYIVFLLLALTLKIPNILIESYLQNKSYNIRISLEYTILVVVILGVVWAFISRNLLAFFLPVIFIGDLASANLANQASATFITGTLLRVVLSLQSLFLIAIFLDRGMERWEFKLSSYCAIMFTAHILLILLSHSSPIDPNRLFLFFIPLLVLVTISSASRELRFNKLKQIKISSIIIVFMSILILITQIWAIPPHVMFTDRDKTTLSEGHYTPSQFEASRWTEKYSSSAIIGYEEGLWAANNNRFLDARLNHCQDQLIVQRPPTKTVLRGQNNIIYSSNMIKLGYC